MASIKLPKQWLHWCKQLHIRPAFHGKYFRGYYLKGKGRYWRVNMYGDLEVSMPYSEFDRWANSCVASHETLPKTFAEFKFIINSLMREAEYGKPV